MQLKTTRQLINDSGVMEKLMTAYNGNDIAGLLQHAESLVRTIRRSPQDKDFLNKIDVIRDRKDVAEIMDLVRRFRSTPSDLYDAEYKKIQTRLYELIAMQSAPREENLMRQHESDTFTSVITRALEESSLDRALNFVCIWESERILQQARRNDFKNWDSCFRFLMHNVRSAWYAREMKETY